MQTKNAGRTGKGGPGELLFAVDPPPPPSRFSMPDECRAWFACHPKIPLTYLPTERRQIESPVLCRNSGVDVTQSDGIPLSCLKRAAGLYGINCSGKSFDHVPRDDTSFKG